MNLMIVFSKYDVSSELMMLGLAVFFLIAMAISRPKRSRILYLNKFSFITAVVTIAVHLMMLATTCYPAEEFSRVQFDILYKIYNLLYITILNEITVYLDLLSYQKRHRTREIVIKVIIQSVVYMILLFYPLVTGKIYMITEAGDVIITKWHFMAEVCGLICAVCAGLSCAIRAKTLSRIVAIGTLIFIPMDMAILVFQLFFDTAYFISYTYVVAFIVFYVLFHCNVFDPESGCQSSSAMFSLIDYGLMRKKLFTIIDVSFPELQNREFSDAAAMVQDATAHVCRKIERIKFGARIFSPNIYTYTYFCFVKNQEEAENIALKMREILEVPFVHKGKEYSANYKQIVFVSDPCIKTSRQIRSMLGYMKHKLTPDTQNEFLIAGPKDYEKFSQYDEAENVVLDVRQNADLEDERIVCYIQPILSNDNRTFRSGEALMRMQVGDKMLFPDTFIPAAERNNCIHRMTLIMLNTVCKKIKELEGENYDFDGITINCSTSELADPLFHKEVIRIVEENQIRPEHLRLEITESIAVSSYRNIYDNMTALDEYGIQFYLDDFGTGFSNLERIAKFPFRTIKFDKSILYSALENEKADALIRMQVDYFHSNGFQTVVEGVEDEEQYNYCTSVGFDMIQGYYFARPQPMNQITDYFEAQ